MSKIVYKYTTESFIKRARETHFDTYSYEFVDYKKSDSKVKILCKIHGIFEQTPSMHISGQGCRLCGYIKSAKLRINCVNNFIENANNLHNNFYDYSEVEYVNNHTKVKLKCPYHGDFLVKPNHHIESKVGCSECAKENRVKNRRKTIENVIKDANKVHNNFYDYSLIKSYKSGKDMLEIICPNHGIFFQKAEGHINSKQGCQACGYIKIGNLVRKSNEDFIKQSIEIHGDLYDYSKTFYTKAHDYVDIICKTHDVFTIIANNHLKGFGCQLCSNTISIPSKKWIASLNNSNIIIEYQLPQNKRRKADGYDPTTNTVYQFHGSYWHSDPRVFDPNTLHQLIKINHKQNYELSNEKDQQLRDWGYNLVIMWEYDWQQLNKKFKEESI